MDVDDRPPICPRCAVTMVPAELSANNNHEDDWVCLECEELNEEELKPTPGPRRIDPGRPLGI